MERFIRVRSTLGALAATVLFSCSDGSGAGATFTREELMKPSTCKECHAQHYTEWSGSMHAYASRDSVFLAMNARGQRDAGLGKFCVNCHAPMAVRENRTKDGLNLTTLSEEYQGITCYFCHQVTEVSGTHDNPLVLAQDATMRAAVADPVPNKAHRGAYSSLQDSNDLESSKLCGSCHDIVVPAHFSGAGKDVELERTYAEWRESIFATTARSQSCGDCHLPTDSGTTIADYPGVSGGRTFHHHRFPGIDVPLTDFPEGNPAEQEEQRKELLSFLRATLGVRLCVNTNGAATVVLENTGAGHGFPSGAAQDRRVWVELRGYDSANKEFFNYGVVSPGSDVTRLHDDGNPESLKIYRDATFDVNDEPAHFFWDAARVERRALNAPVTTDKLDPRYHKVGDVDSMTVSTGRAAGGLARLTATVHVQPIGFDVLDALYATPSGDAGTAMDGSDVRAAMPILDLLPNSGSTTTVEWTYAAVMRHQSESDAFGDCFTTAKPPR